MTETVSIEIKDSINSNISKKIKEIANSAKTAYSAIERLKDQLKSIDVNAVTKLTNAYDKLQNTSLRNAKISAQLAMAQQREARTAEINAIAQQRLQTEMQRTEAAKIRAEKATLQLQNAQQRAANSTANLDVQADKLKRSIDPLYDAQRLYDTELAKASMLLQKGAIDTATYERAVEKSTSKLESAKRGFETYNNSMAKSGEAANLSRHHLVNLGYQLNDVFVSLASGQKPLTVFIQQGSQIAGIAAAANISLKAMAMQIGLMLAPFMPFVAAIGAVVAGLELMTREVDKSGKFEEYARSLGATSKEIKRLGLDSSSYMDVLKGLGITIVDTVKKSETLKQIKSNWSDLTNAIKKTDTYNYISKMWEDVYNKTAEVFKGIGTLLYVSFVSNISAFSAVKDTIVAVWKKLIPEFKSIYIDLYNDTITYFEKIANGVIGTTNDIIKTLNSVGNTKLELFENISFNDSKIKQISAETGKDISQVFIDSYNQNFKDNDKAITGFIDGLSSGSNKFMKDWKKNTEEATKDRIKDIAEENGILEKRANKIAKINEELDNEIARLRMLQPLREQQQRYDQIEEQLMGQGIRLSEQQSKAWKDKIKIIQEGQYVQKAMDSIYENSVGPLRDYNAQIEASNLLLNRGIITQKKYNESMIVASNNYLNAINPLKSYNDELNKQLEILNKTIGMTDLEANAISNSYQKKNELASKGIILSDREIESLINKNKQLLKTQSRQEALNSIYNQTAGATNDLINKQEALNTALEKGVITAEAYNIQLQDTNSKLLEINNKAGKGTFLSGVSEGLSRFASETKTLASSIADVTNSAFDNMTDTLADFITTGKASFKDLVNSIVRDLAKIAIRQSITAPLASALSGAFAGGFSNVGTAATYGTNIGSQQTAMLAAQDAGFKNGGAFGSSGAKMFANGGTFTNSIVSSPTAFSYGGGNLGVMGEAGDEAVMPLTRIGGKLGVQAVGSNSGPMKVIINVENNTTQDITAEQIGAAMQTNGAGDKEFIINVVLDSATRNTNNFKDTLKSALSR
jgi:lambda family phage tail tape measure protein